MHSASFRDRPSFVEFVERRGDRAWRRGFEDSGERFGHRHGDRLAGFFLVNRDGARFRVVVLRRDPHAIGSAKARVRGQEDDRAEPRGRGGEKFVELVGRGDGLARLRPADVGDLFGEIGPADGRADVGYELLERVGVAVERRVFQATPPAGVDGLEVERGDLVAA